MHLLDVFGQLASFGLEKYKFHKIDLFLRLHNIIQ